MPLLRILTLPPPSPRKTRAPAPASLAGNPGLSNGGGGGSGCWRNVTLGRWPRHTALLHGAQRPGWTRGVAGLGTARRRRTLGRGLCCWQRHPARHAPSHEGSRAGRVTHGGSEEAHRWEKRPSTASLGTGNAQQCGELLLGTGEREITAPWAVCEQKPVSAFEMAPSECCE